EGKDESLLKNHGSQYSTTDCRVSQWQSSDSWIEQRCCSRCPHSEGGVSNPGSSGIARRTRIRNGRGPLWKGDNDFRQCILCGSRPPAQGSSRPASRPTI